MITLVLFLIAGILNAAMDKIAFTFDNSIFSKLNPLFWDVRISWKNQYKQPLRPSTPKWYYFKIFQPPYEETFPYSSSALVMFTDAWHLAKFLMLVCLCCGAVCYQPLLTGFLDFVLFYLAFTVTFTIFYTKIFDKRFYGKK